MKLFKADEFLRKYTHFNAIEEIVIEEASEMIFTQVSPCYRDSRWNDTNVPEAIKNASMEQARFLMSYEIPHIDSHKLKAGAMEADLITEYSTLALSILANAGYQYRGNPINYNMSMGIEMES